MAAPAEGRSSAIPVIHSRGALPGHHSWDKDALLRSLSTAMDKSLLPRRSEDAGHNGGPPAVFRTRLGQRFPVLHGEPISIRSSAPKYFCREMLPG